MHTPTFISGIKHTSKESGAKRFGFLDQLRAIACLAVALCHLNPTLLPGGGIGVGVFFALSGYLISSICMREVTDIRSALAFMTRRIFRVYPLMLVDLIVLWIAYTFFYTDLRQNFLAALPDLLLMKNMPSPFIGIGVGVLWTLQVEFAFYILAPIFVLLLRPKRGLWIFAIVLLLTTSIGIASSYLGAKFNSLTTTINSIPILSWGGALALGVIVALTWKAGAFGRFAGKPSSRLLAYPLALFGVAVVIALLVFPHPTDRIWHVQILLASLAGSALILGWLLHPTLLVVPGLPFIGRISFSIYLIHAVLADFAHYLNQTIGFSNPFSNPFMFIPVVICAAYVSYRLVEQPGIKAGAFFAKKISREKARVGFVPGFQLAALEQNSSTVLTGTNGESETSSK